MKDIDKDIEQFENNLIEIDKMRNQISELSNSLYNTLNETKDINSIKEGLESEIETLHKTNENSVKKIDERIDELKDSSIEIKKLIDKDSDRILIPIKEELSKIMDKFKKINDLDKSINEIKVKQELLEKKQNIFLILMIIIIVLSIISMFVR